MGNPPGAVREHRLYAAMYDSMVRHVERAGLAERRRRMLGGLRGRILDVGAGTGANLAFYPTAARVTAVEPDAAMRRQLTAKLRDRRHDIEVLDAVAESLPFSDEHFDAVIFTLVLCTVADQDRALSEAFRVLRPGGALVLLEHVAGGPRMRRWQGLVDPLWARTQAGCHVVRDTPAGVRRAGFYVDRCESFRGMPAVVPASPMVEMIAHRPL